MDKRYKVMAMASALIALAWFVLNRAVHKIFNLYTN